MDILKKAVLKNEFRNKEPPKMNFEKELNTTNTLWGVTVRNITPANLITAMLMMEDPLMVLAGNGYKNTEVRDKTFQLLQESQVSIALKGNRKLSKAKIADAFGALKPTIDHTKVIAGVLFAMRGIQTVLFNEKDKTLWTMPEDLRNWKNDKKTLWVDESCQKYLEITNELHLGKWISEREKEGWSINWPISEGSFEDIKRKLSVEYPELQVHGEGKRAKKEDYAKVLGKAEAITVLNKI